MKMGNRDYYAAAKFYGVGCILLTLLSLSLFIAWCRASSGPSNEGYWAKKYDSLYVVSNIMSYIGKHSIEEARDITL